MNNSDADNRLLHAKKLLKKYQKKGHLMPTGDCGYTNDGGLHDNALELHSNGSINHVNASTASINSSRPSSAVDEKRLISNSSSLHNHFIPDAENNVEAVYLRNLLHQKEESLKEVSTKLQQLHTHYSELYTAYNAANQRLQANIPSSEYGEQIQQLQTTLAVVTEEKTNLQAELRSLKFRLEALESENNVLKEQQKESSKAATTSVASPFIEQQLQNLRDERENLLKTIANQASQIEAHRKECSHLEAKILTIHQDRNEAQARLKYLCEEKCNLEKDVEQLRNELNLKDIYIRQLTRFSSADPAQDQLVIQALTNEKDRFAEEAESRKAEIAELKSQFDASRQHYELCVAEMSRNISSLETELAEFRVAKTNLESSNNHLEEQLRVMKTLLDKKAEDVLKPTDQEPVTHEAYTDLQNRFLALQEDFSRCRDRVQDLESFIEQKDNQLESLQYAFFDAQRKIVELEEAKTLQNSINTDVASLSQQLQNEKATVSRAVSQNVELKKLLEEFQDKIIVVTNDCAAKEEEKNSLVVKLSALQRSFDEHLKHCSRTRLDSESGNLERNGNAPSKETTNVADGELTAEQTLRTVEEIKNLTISENDSAIVIPHPDDLKTGVSVQKEGDEMPTAQGFISDDRSGNCDEVAERVGSGLLTTTVAPPTDSNDEMVKDPRIVGLEQRLQEALTENEAFRQNNQRLEYWLTALETENESIGEYIALYRFQRTNIQKKATENEVALMSVKQKNDQLEAEMERLKSSMAEKNKLLKEVSCKLQRLHGYYSELYTAYNSTIQAAMLQEVSKTSVNGAEADDSNKVHCSSNCDHSSPRPTDEVIVATSEGVQKIIAK